MKRIYKVFLILIIIQVISLYVCNSYAKVTASLSEFVKKNGIDKMTEDQLDSKRGEILGKLEEYNEDTKNTVALEVSRKIANIEDMHGYDLKIQKLEEEFRTQAGYASSENDETYQYYGYMLGGYYVIYKKNSAETKEEEKKGKTAAEQFDEKYKKFKKLSDEDKKDKIKMSDYASAMKALYNKLSKSEKTDKRTEQLDEVLTAFVKADDSVDEVPDIIYQYPAKNETTAGSSLDDMIGDADRFINSAGDSTISQTSLQKFSKTYYNILFTIGVVVATLVGLVLGIRFMISGAEGKANIKELLVPYIVGCVVVFGAFAIWKLLVSILSGM